jgi:hypothetical protein
VNLRALSEKERAIVLIVLVAVVATLLYAFGECLYWLG